MFRALSRADQPTVQNPDFPIVVATLMREQGDTGVQTHFNVFLDYYAAQGRGLMCVTPFSNAKLAVYPVFAIRRVIDLLHGEASVWWYRHWHYAFLKMALRRLLADGRPRVIYAQCPLSADAALEVRTTESQRVVLVVHFNESQAEEWAGKGMLRRKGRYYKSIRCFERAVLPRLDGIVFVSAFMQGILTQAVPEMESVPSIVIPNFISKPQHKMGEPSRDLISIGTLEPRKNQEYLLRVLAAAKQLERRLTLTIVGEGSERRRLQSLARELAVDDQIDFVGFRPNAADMISDHRVYCHAAHIENLPITIIEAMARGIPVLAGPVGGIPEVFDNGVEGLYWDLNDSYAGVRQALRLLDNPALRKEFGIAARKRFARCFETHVVAERLAQFLHSRLG